MSGPRPLLRRVPSFTELSAGDAGDVILGRFLDYVNEKGLSLYPAQEEAILNLIQGDHVILNTPTGSGKSLVAEALVFQSMALGKRVVYTCPVKALVNEKFLSLCRLFGAESVGLMTGDGSVNRDAPIVCCTAEILANMALSDGAEAKVDDVVMDEFHYYADRERGIAWQIPLLELKHARFLLMSATMGNMEFFAEHLEKITGRSANVVVGHDRPVPLEFEYRAETHLHESIADLLKADRAPVYLVNFTQAAASEEAQNLMSVDFLSKDQKKAILDRLDGVSFRSPFGRDLQRFLKHGIGVHHAGLLPRYRILVEKLAQDGLLKVISGTDTLGVGVNIPIRTVLFTKLCKYDGDKTAILSSRDFHQISGRAGRRGFDSRGFVVAQAPEHVIENAKLERKALADPKKAKKIVKAKPPERGFVMWSEDTFKKLQSSKPEPLESRFHVDHGLVLSVLARKNHDGCEALRLLIRHSHEPEGRKKAHRRRAFELFRSLYERQIVTLNPLAVHDDLQHDFSLHQSLSLWLIDTLAQLDPLVQTHAFDVITLCEAIVESPDLILRKQTDRVRQELFYQLKQEGVEFDERQERLEAVEHPKPLREFIYSTFNAWSERHPWVGGENIRPKSIAREMLEKGMSFSDYIREYDLQRGEGLLLRTLNDVFKVLAQTVPDRFKTDEIRDLELELAGLIRGVDSSLLEEWDRLREDFVELGGKVAGSAGGAAAEAGEAEALSRFQREKERERLWRVETFRLVKALAAQDLDDGEALIREWKEKGAVKVAFTIAGETVEFSVDEWTVSRLETVLEKLKADGFTGIRTDTPARAKVLFSLVQGERVQQVVVSKDAVIDKQTIDGATADILILLSS